MRKNFNRFVILLLTFCSSGASGQDTIFTKRGEIITGTVVYADRWKIAYRSPENQRGEPVILRRSAILKVHSTDSTGNFYRFIKRQLALGITCFADPTPSRTVDFGKYGDIGSKRFFTAGTLLSMHYRGEIWGIRISSGWSYKYKEVDWSYRDNVYQGLHSYSWRRESYHIPIYLSPRLHLLRTRNNPFFEYTVGTEILLSETAVDEEEYNVPFIWKCGFGFQASIAKKWLAEFKVGAYKREEFKNRNGGGAWVANFEISVYKILFSKN